MSVHVHLTPVSANAKTGPIPVSTTSADTCPGTCPFRHDREGGCYATSGPLALHWAKVTRGERGDAWPDFCRKVAKLAAGALWRHNQAGDLPHDPESGSVAVEMLRDLVKANAVRRKRGFTYTHHDVIRNHRNRNAIREANATGFTINLSGNNLAHADELVKTSCGPVVTVLPASIEGRAEIFTPAGHRVVVCPATYRDDVSCATCGLCAVADRRIIVGFPAHGSGARRASTVATREA